MQNLILPIKDFKPTAGYKNGKYRKYWGHTHFGADCGSPSKNRALYGLGNGTVVAAGLDGLNGKTTGKGSGCGYCLVIIYKDCYNHKTGEVMDLVCTYMHMAELPKVKASDKVTTKTLLGYYGNTGKDTSGPHLHIQFDTDTHYPLYCTGISSKGHALLRRGSINSTVNPCEVLHIGAGQTVNAVFSQWYDQYAFKLLPTAGAVKKSGKEKAKSDENPFAVKIP